MDIPIVTADLEARLGEDDLARYSRGSSTFIADCIAGAWDSARSAGLNIFTAESWDAMTAETLPAEAKIHIVSHACYLLAGGTSTRPEFLDTMNKDAAQWRSWLAGDKVRCFDDILERTETRDEDAGVTYETGTRKFDRTAEGGDYWAVPRRS